MTIELTWLGHAAWAIKAGEHHILIDPFLNDSPTAPVKADDVEANFILVSHGHYDHVADVASIANRTGATVVSNYEIATWFAEKHQVKNTLGMNLGGGVDLPFGRVKLTIAFHSSQLPDGSYGGNPGGWLLTIADKKIYFACDTALFSDMQMIGNKGIDLAVLPIGDMFTMGPDDSIEAIHLILPKKVVPSHYNTWPPIAQDAEAWAARVKRDTISEPIVVKPGGTIKL
jgi:L-ascorbate metabolism protein UlaG (beta-lactamase superfamily)